MNHYASSIQIVNVAGSNFGDIEARNTASSVIYSLGRKDTVSTGDLAISTFGGFGIQTGLSGSKTTGLYKFYINSTGNVGIGTTTLTYPLEVSKTDSANTSTTNVLALTHLSTGSSGLNMGTGMVFRVQNSTYGITVTGASISSYQSNESVINNPLVFSNTVGNILAERMRISDKGNILIGTTTDTSKSLYVNGTSEINARLYVDKGLSVSNIFTTHHVYSIGDSLTYSSGTGAYEAQLNTLLGITWTVLNKGISGNTTANMLARFQTDVIDPGDAEYVIIWGGVNDVIQGVAEVTTESNLQAMYTMAHNAGIKVISVNISPFKGYSAWTVGKQTTLENVNTWIASTATNVDYKVNVYSLLQDPGNLGALLSTYDGDDHLHLSTSGYNLVGSTVNSSATFTGMPAPTNTLFVTGGGTFTGNVGIGTTIPANALAVVGSISIGSAGVARGTTAGTNRLDIFDGTAPVGTLANGISIYSSAGEAYIMDAAGNATLQSPHDLNTNYWVFDSKNAVKNTSLVIDMEQMMKQLNVAMGWDYVHETLNGVTLSATPIPLNLPDTFFSAIAARITTWLADAGNGIADLYVKVMHSDKVETNNLCIKKSDGTDVCVTGDQLDALLSSPPSQGGVPASGGGGGNPATCSDGIQNQDETGVDTGGVCAPADPVTLESIAITTPATKLSYAVGETLDITDLVITGTYSDATTKVETIASSDVTGFDSSVTVTGQVLTVTIGEKTITYLIDVVETAQ